MIPCCQPRKRDVFADLARRSRRALYILLRIEPTRAHTAPLHVEVNTLRSYLKSDENIRFIIAQITETSRSCETMSVCADPCICNDSFVFMWRCRTLHNALPHLHTHTCCFIHSEWGNVHPPLSQYHDDVNCRSTPTAYRML